MVHCIFVFFSIVQMTDFLSLVNITFICIVDKLEHIISILKLIEWLEMVLKSTNNRTQCTPNFSTPWEPNISNTGLFCITINTVKWRIQGDKFSWVCYRNYRNNFMRGKCLRHQSFCGFTVWTVKSIFFESFYYFHYYSHSLTVHNIHQMHITIYANKQTCIKWLFNKHWC